MDAASLAELLLFATVRIEAHSLHGSSTGTAFIFSNRQGEQDVPFLVTNKHVVDGAAVGHFFFTLSDGSQPRLGQRFDVKLDDFEHQWHGHPDPNVDIAVMPLAPVLEEAERAGKQVYFNTIGHDMIPTPDQLKALDAIEEVVFIGYPNGIYDAVNLLPVVRRGITATPPQVDYDGTPTFLIDASVFPGSSGSPVLIVNPGGYPNKLGGYNFNARFFFLGVVARVLIRQEHGQIGFVPVPTTRSLVIKTQQMIDLGVVYRASAILDIPIVQRLAAAHERSAPSGT